MVDDPLLKRLVAVRRDLHQHPELRFEERRTSKIVRAFLDDVGLPYVESAGTGVVAWTRDDDRPTVLLRADLDALPIKEISGVPWSSTIDGKMHACGHDGHTAILLGAAAVLARRKDLAGNVRFVFQPAEEGGHGALRMIEDGAWRGTRVDRAFALHNWPEIPFGTWGIRSGGVMAANDVLHVTIEGRGGHAADPHLTIDPVHVAAQFLVAVHGMKSRAIDAHEPVVISFCTMKAADATNVIPDVVKLGGTLRTLSRAARDDVPGRIRRVLDGICAAYGATGHLTVERGYPVTVNDAETAAIAARAAIALPGWTVDDTLTPSMGSEDFAYFTEQVPSAYVWMGTGDADHPHVCHQARYDFNDRALGAGVSWFVNVAEQALGTIA